MADELFRKSAHDKLASPERLDVLMRVTSPKGWAALWAIGGVLVAVVAWSIFGSLPDRIEGQGQLIQGGGTREITASGEGVLTRLDVKINDTVQPDQIIGEVKGGSAGESASAASGEVDRLTGEAQRGELDDKAAINSINQDIQSYQEDIARFTDQLKLKQADLEQKNEAYKAQIITKGRVEQVQAEVNALTSQISGRRENIRSKQVQIANVQAKTRLRWDDVERARRRANISAGGYIELSQVKVTVAGR